MQVCSQRVSGPLFFPSCCELRLPPYELALRFFVAFSLTFLLCDNNFDSASHSVKPDAVVGLERAHDYSQYLYRLFALLQQVCICLPVSRSQNNTFSVELRNIGLDTNWRCCQSRIHFTAKRGLH